MMVHMNPKESQIHLAACRLFDGTVSRWPTQAEAHYRELLEKDPGNYFVWNRLGNIYKTGDVPDLALEAYHKALELNEHDIESLHSIAEIYLDREEPAKAAEYFHRVLLQARHAPRQTEPELVRGIVEDSLLLARDIHQDSGKTIPLLPPEIEAEMRDKSGSSGMHAGFNLSNERDLEKLIGWLMTGKPPVPSAQGGQPPRPAPRPQPLRRAPPPAPSGKVGRNDPCPCGSGRKFKNCCLRS
jgi:tetratricopeptide (TPR) repeat protein